MLDKLKTERSFEKTALSGTERISWVLSRLLYRHIFDRALIFHKNSWTCIQSEEI